MSTESPPHAPIDVAARFDKFPGYPLVDAPHIKRRLADRGVEVIDLGAGDADLMPPQVALEALRQAAGEPSMNRYAFQSGLPQLREAIVAWMARRFGVELDPVEEILPVIGSKDGIAHIAFAYVDSGDLTIVPDPGYVPYAGGTLLAGGEPFRAQLKAENDFLIPLEELPADIVKHAKVLYLNYPNNPTTAIAPRSYLELAVEFCRQHGIVLVYDNAYSEIAFDGYSPPSILEIEGAKDVAVEFHSFSKTYNMTGWRIGWAAGGAASIGALRRVKTFVDTGPFLPIQAAAAAALGSHETWVPGNVAEFQRRRDALVGALRSIGREVEAPKATMYVWLRLEEGRDSQAFALNALEEHGVMLMAGASLGAGGEGYVRFALTRPPDKLEAAVARIAGMLGS